MATLTHDGTRSVALPSLRRLAPVDLAALGLVLLQAAVLAAVALPGSFYLDDLVTTSRGAASDLTWSYLRGPSGHHLAPGAMLAFWVQAHAAPLQHGTAVASLLVLQAATTLLLWRLLRELVGPHRLALVPLGVYALTPLAVPSFAWWVQAVCLLPVHLAAVGATLAHLRFTRSRQVRYAVAAGLWVAFGLLFWEKGVVAAVLPLLVTLATAQGSRLRHLARQWPSVVALLLPVVVLASVYRATDRQQARSVGPLDALQLVGDSTRGFVVPSLLGGPWRWSRQEYYGLAAVPTWAQAVAGAVLGLLVVVTVRRRRAAWRGWALLAVYVPVSLAPVAAGRLAQYGTVVGLDSRYVTDIAVAEAVALALVLLPLRGAVEPAARPLPRATWGLLPLVLAGCAVSDVQFATRWADNPVGAYVSAVRGDLPAGRQVALYDTALPEDVLNALYAPYDRTSALLAQLPGRTRFQDGQVPLSVLTPDGHVRPAELREVAGTGPGPVPGCGWRVERTTTDVPLPYPVDAFVDRTARVQLLLSAASPVTVTTQDGLRLDDGQVLPAGLVDVVALVPGQDLTGVRVGGLSLGVTACVSRVLVGSPQPAAAP